VSELAEERQQPRILARPEHPVSRADISENALKVLYRLHGSSFLAYLVGGAVRDLLLGRRPKDFDVGTNARPQQVRRLFHNARLIGRRFRLAHVRFADEIVEVATFRRSATTDESEAAEEQDALAPIAESEEFGTPEEDAWRRDFTVNALFYNIADFSVVDYVGGLEDLEAGVIRSVGPASRRFLEDPVRMMRAVEYAARLGFEIEPATANALFALTGEIRRAAPARIAYELMESLTGGQALEIFRGLADVGLLSLILPEVSAGLRGSRPDLVWKLLRLADARAARGTPLRPDTLLGLLFLPSFLDRAGAWEEGGLRRRELERTVREYLDPPATRLSLSNFRAHVLRHAFLLLARLSAPPASVKSVVRALRQEAFPTAWELMELLTETTGAFEAERDAWRSAKERVERGLPPLQERPVGGSKRGKRRRRRRSRGEKPEEVS
jgi:poly(A) polymerase